MLAAMPGIVTIAERQARALQRRRGDIDAVIAALRGYAIQSGGRFLVFGSVATGHIRADSDLDVMVDFPDSGEDDARSFAERTCREHGVPGDIHCLSTSSDRFLERIGPHAIVLG